MDPNKLFDYINIFFTNRQKFKEIPKSIKNKHFFMLNRFMSIKYPLMAFQLSKLSINQIDATNLMHNLVTSSNRVPQWIYTQTKSDIVTKEFKMDKDIAKIYCIENEIGIKILNRAVLLNPTIMKKVETEFKNILKVKK